MIIGEGPLVSRPTITVAPSLIVDYGRTEVVKDNKDDIISKFWWAMFKRKAILAMGEASSNVLNIRMSI